VLFATQAPATLLALALIVPLTAGDYDLSVGSTVALAGMLYVGWQTPSGAGDLVPGLLVLGVGIGLSTPAVQTVSMAAVERAKSGMAAGVSSTARYLGGVIGVGVVSTLLAGSPDALAAHKTAAHVLAVVLLLAILAAAALPSPPSPPRTT
jgi:ribose/xylose/arabinose/galactoside ABC-type transport system permease subunit